MNQLYMSNQHLSPGTARSYADMLLRFAPTHMIVYPSSMAVFAAAVLDQGLSIPKMKVIISNAEPLTAAHRTLIEEACGCPVRESYGMCEMAAAGSECSEGRLHIWPRPDTGKSCRTLTIDPAQQGRWDGSSRPAFSTKTCP